jgi:hypothetical protein
MIIQIGRLLIYVLPKFDNNGVKVAGDYKPLIAALLRRVTAAQLEYMQTRTNRRDTILFIDLVDCFEIVRVDFFEELENDIHAEFYNCICGVKIEYVYYIRNKDTEEIHKIGRVCITNWANGDRKKLRSIENLKRRIDDTAGDTRCDFCKRKTTKKKCLSCPMRKICANIVTRWISRMKKCELCCNTYINNKIKYCAGCTKNMKKCYTCNGSIKPNEYCHNCVRECISCPNKIRKSNVNICNDCRKEKYNKCPDCFRMKERKYPTCYVCKLNAAQKKSCGNCSGTGEAYWSEGVYGYCLEC